MPSGERRNKEMEGEQIKKENIKRRERLREKGKKQGRKEGGKEKVQC